MTNDERLEAFYKERLEAFCKSLSGRSTSSLIRLMIQGRHASTYDTEFGALNTPAYVVISTGEITTVVYGPTGATGSTGPIHSILGGCQRLALEAVAREIDNRMPKFEQP